MWCCVYVVVNVCVLYVVYLYVVYLYCHPLRYVFIIPHNHRTQSTPTINTHNHHTNTQSTHTHTHRYAEMLKALCTCIDALGKLFPQQDPASVLCKGSKQGLRSALDAATNRPGNSTKV